MVDTDGGGGWDVRETIVHVAFYDDTARPPSSTPPASPSS
jgi:hypothetical protein